MESGTLDFGSFDFRLHQDFVPYTLHYVICVLRIVAFFYFYEANVIVSLTHIWSKDIKGSISIKAKGSIQSKKRSGIFQTGV